jgi:hypothetical protein
MKLKHVDKIKQRKHQIIPHKIVKIDLNRFEKEIKVETGCQ